MTEHRAAYAPDEPVLLSFRWPCDTSLNARLHWAKRGDLNAAHAWEGYNAANGRKLPPGQYQAHITFYPPDHRRYDLDNMLARLKKHIDGACKALGIDDSCIRRVTLEWGAVSKPGAVEVAVTRFWETWGEV